jgi:deoxyribonuclease-4
LAELDTCFIVGGASELIGLIIAFLSAELLSSLAPRFIHSLFAYLGASFSVQANHPIGPDKGPGLTAIELSLEYMVLVGVHVSIAGGVDRAVDRAVERGCDLFQIFSRNPRGWASRELSAQEAKRFAEKMGSSGLRLAADHMPYLPNLASPKDDVYTKSIRALAEELQRCRALRIPYLVTHLGSHLGSGWEAGLERIAGAIEYAFSQTDDIDVILLLENTAGGENSMGSSFKDIGTIIERLNSRRLGVCLDTCHLFAAGYELRTAAGVEETLEDFDQEVGLKLLKLVHLNDSASGPGSRLDRHAHIGLGKIGEPGMRAILANEHLKGLPMILETPVDSVRDDVGNLQVVRSLCHQLER